MSKHRPSGPQRPPNVPVQRFLPVPDHDSRHVPPAAINAVRVTGGLDSFIFEFYHLDDIELALVTEGVHQFSNTGVREGMRLLPNGTVLVESKPVARVSLPAGVALDFVLQAFATGAQSLPRLKAQFLEAGDKFKAIMSTFEAFNPTAGGGEDGSSGS